MSNLAGVYVTDGGQGKEWNAVAELDNCPALYCIMGYVHISAGLEDRTEHSGGCRCFEKG